MNRPPATFDCSPMDTQIFNLGLSVTATSAYILITALVGDGVRPELGSIRDRWNASPEELDRALADLADHNVIERHPGLEGSEPVYLVNPASLWGVAREPWPAPKPLPVHSPKKD